MSENASELPFVRGARDFRTTHWSVVVSAGLADSPERSLALQQLCQTYWPCIYTFIRRRGTPEEEAKDLTQAFFARLLEKNAFKDADSTRGKFRTFLLCSLTYFLANEWDKAQRQKRGGGLTIVSLENLAELEREISAASTTPEKAFDRSWAEKLLGLVLARLREEFERAGNLARFEHLKIFLIASDTGASYAQIAQELGMSEVNVRSSVSRLRHRFRELMRDHIADTVSRPEEVDEEIRYLFQVLAS